MIEYAGEIWSLKCINQLEKIELRYFKMLLGLRTNTCTPAIYAELGRFPLVIILKIRVFKYWSRLTRLNDDMIVRKVQDG